jgi:hypothetical protein
MGHCMAACRVFGCLDANLHSMHASLPSKSRPTTPLTIVCRVQANHGWLFSRLPFQKDFSRVTQRRLVAEPGG